MPTTSFSTSQPARTLYAQHGVNGKAGHDSFFHTVTDGSSTLETLVNGTEKTVAQYLKALANSDSYDDHELVMNCAAGRTDIARYAKDLMAEKMSSGLQHNGQLESAQTIRSMAQHLVSMSNIVKNWGTAPANQPELLLLAATRFKDEHKARIPADVRNAVQKFGQNEWKPAWWNAQGPDENHEFSMDTLRRVPQGFTNIPTQTKMLKVAGDGACMFRACLAAQTRDLSWINTNTKDKQAVYDKLVELKWDDKIKTAIRLALHSLVESWLVTTQTADTLNVDDLFNKTIASRDFTLYSGNGIKAALDGMASSHTMSAEVCETFADTIATHLLNEIDAPQLPSNLSELAGNEGAWPLLENVHYNLLITEGFSTRSDPHGVLDSDRVLMSLV